MDDFNFLHNSHTLRNNSDVRCILLLCFIILAGEKKSCPYPLYWKYGSTHSYCLHYIEASVQLHTPAASAQKKGASGIHRKCVWTLSRREKSDAPAGNGRTISRLSSPRPTCTYWAIPNFLIFRKAQKSTSLFGKWFCFHTWLYNKRLI